MPRLSPSAFATASPSAMPDVLDRVMLIDVEIAVGAILEIEPAVPGDELEHVIEEADAGADLVAARPSSVRRQRDLRLGGLAGRLPRAAQDLLQRRQAAARVCSTTPGRDAHAAGAARLARSIADEDAALREGATTRAASSPTRTSTKLRGARPVAEAEPLERS